VHAFARRTYILIRINWNSRCLKLSPLRTIWQFKISNFALFLGGRLNVDTQNFDILRLQNSKNYIIVTARLQILFKF